MWNECKDLQEYIVGLRRDLHQIPELGIASAGNSCLCNHRAG